MAKTRRARDALLSLDEAPHHPHLAARGTFVPVDGITLPAIKNEPYFVAVTKTRDIDVATAARLAELQARIDKLA